MQIAVNTRLLQKKNLDGIGQFSVEILKRLCVNMAAQQFLFIFDRKEEQDYIFCPNVQYMRVPPPTRHPLLIKTWFNYAIPLSVRLKKADIFFSPDGFLSPNLNIPQIPVVHDLNFLHYPQAFPEVYKKLFLDYFVKNLLKADHIITVSNFSKNDIVNSLQIPAEKITVAYNGRSDAYRPLQEEEKNNVRKRYTQGKPYFIFIGTLIPRKNIARLLQAFDKFKTTYQTEHKLLIVGNKRWWDTEMEEAFINMLHHKSVVFTGYLPQNQMPYILGAAECLLFVPLFEGFGIPLVDAMAANVPIISSNTSAMPEVVGKAALLVNPLDIDAIVAAMCEIITEKTQCQHLIQAGNRQLKLFSWDNSAQIIAKLLQSYN
ncbi:MAG: glycosyltransferase family 1 protein [Chitinophagales bacterium]|nr:glycosyltransferase family 4 protein [Bacteroidota bacterium]MCB9044480.1 glycosyltransferase family 4 protein [Chitinophagales bacterium]